MKTLTTSSKITAEKVTYFSLHQNEYHDSQRKKWLSITMKNEVSGWGSTYRYSRWSKNRLHRKTYKMKTRIEIQNESKCKNGTIRTSPQ